MRGAAGFFRAGRDDAGRWWLIDPDDRPFFLRGVHGVHVMAYRQEETVAEVIDRSGVLAGRVPWYPTRDTPQQSSELTADKVAS